MLTLPQIDPLTLQKTTFNIQKYFNTEHEISTNGQLIAQLFCQDLDLHYEPEEALTKMAKDIFDSLCTKTHSTHHINIFEHILMSFDDISVDDDRAIIKFEVEFNSNFIELNFPTQSPNYEYLSRRILRMLSKLCASIDEAMEYIPCFMGEYLPMIIEANLNTDENGEIALDDIPEGFLSMLSDNYGIDEDTVPELVKNSVEYDRIFGDGGLLCTRKGSIYDFPNLVDDPLIESMIVTLDSLDIELNKVNDFTRKHIGELMLEEQEMSPYFFHSFVSTGSVIEEELHTELTQFGNNMDEETGLTVALKNGQQLKQCITGLAMECSLIAKILDAKTNYIEQFNTQVAA